MAQPAVEAAGGSDAVSDYIIHIHVHVHTGLPEQAMGKLPLTCRVWDW